jgi:hypothetical protein
MYYLSFSLIDLQNKYPPTFKFRFMVEPKEKEVSNDGFVTSSKAITLSIVSVCVWGFTLVLYKMILTITKGVNYEVFCLFCSFILSLVTGIALSKNIYSRTDKLRFLAMMLNVFLIYTSANGIQAGNAAFSNSSENVEKTSSKLALFGLLDARPWLPDVNSKKKILELTEENRSLTDSVENYRMALSANDQIGTIKRLSDDTARLIKEIKELKIALAAPHQTPSNELEPLKAENNSLRGRLNNYVEKINGYIKIRSEWIDKTNSDREFAYFANQLKSRLNSFKFSNNYYDQLFFYDLTPPK